MISFYGPVLKLSEGYRHNKPTLKDQNMFVCALIHTDTLTSSMLCSNRKQIQILGSHWNTNKSCASSTASGEMHDTISVMQVTRKFMFISTTSDKKCTTSARKVHELELVKRRPSRVEGQCLEDLLAVDFVFNAKKANVSTPQSNILMVNMQLLSIGMLGVSQACWH